jgi:hypothetical protein
MERYRYWVPPKFLTYRANFHDMLNPGLHVWPEVVSSHHGIELVGSLVAHNGVSMPTFNEVFTHGFWYDLTALQANDTFGIILQRVAKIWISTFGSFLEGLLKIIVAGLCLNQVFNRRSHFPLAP